MSATGGEGGLGLGAVEFLGMMRPHAGDLSRQASPHTDRPGRNCRAAGYRQSVRIVGNDSYKDAGAKGSRGMVHMGRTRAKRLIAMLKRVLVNQPSIVAGCLLASLARPSPAA